jgi:hypothetical protein
MGEHPRFAAAGTGQDQSRRQRSRDGGALSVVKSFK